MILNGDFSPFSVNDFITRPKMKAATKLDCLIRI